ncbi:hypothetical protein [Streptomyces mayteni]
MTPTTATARLEPGTILTPDQIRVDATYYGVRIVVIEDADALLAIGTHDLRRAIAAWSRYLRETTGETLQEHLALCAPGCTASWCTRYGCRTLPRMLDLDWLLFRVPDLAENRGPDRGWDIVFAAADIPGAIPVVAV